MKLSETTQNILKNYSTINQSIYLKKGSRVSTISVMRNILSASDVSETFPVDFCIYDLGKFLNLLKIYPELDFWGIAEPYLDNWLKEQFSPLRLKEFIVENKEDIHYITHRQLDQVDTNKSLFIAAYSLSECSFDVRKEVEVYLKDYDYIIIIYNKMFNNEYDNVKYFNDIQETVLCNHECDVIFSEESSKWWLVCKKK
jgi:hypothetical protein